MEILLLAVYVALGLVYYATLREEGPQGLGGFIGSILTGGAVIAITLGFILPIGLVGAGIAWLNEKL